MLNNHRERFRKLTFRALALRQSEFEDLWLSYNEQNICNKKQQTNDILGGKSAHYC